MDINELESFELADAVKFHDKLNPVLWDEGNRMRPEVREALLKIAQDFQEFMGIGDFALEDITVSGSNAAYSYTPHSDIDLHLIVDQSQLNPSEVYKELFNAKKYQYNDQHDFKIKGYDVEVYVQDSNQPHESLGVYSLVKDDWNRIPTARRAHLDEPTTKVKYEKLGHVIEQALRSDNYAYVDQVLDTVKKYRKAGLDEKGEFGPENLAFKALRKSGLVQKLWDHRANLKDQQLSLREKVAKPRKSWGKFNGMQFEGQEEIEVDHHVVDVEKEVEKFVRYAAKFLKLKRLPQILLRGPEFSHSIHSFGHYVDDDKKIEVETTNRQIMDILRTVAHEMVHFRQHETQDVPDDAGETGSKFENEANALGGVIMRHWQNKHPELLQAKSIGEPVVDEGKLSKAAAAAALGTAVAAGSPPAEAGWVSDVANTARAVYNAPQNYTKAGIQGEIGQEFQNFVRAQAGDASAQNQSHINRAMRSAPQSSAAAGGEGSSMQDAVAAAERNAARQLGTHDYRVVEREVQPMGGGQFRAMVVVQPVVREASGYIPTRAQAKDPRFKTALTVDVKPGQIGKEANKLGLNVDSQGHPDLLIKSLANQLREFKETGNFNNKPKSRFGYTPLTQVPGEVEDDLGNQEATGPEFPPQMPAGTTKIDVKDLTDWYQIGMDISDLDDADPEDYNQGPPQTVIVFPSDEAEQAYLKQFKRLGLKTHDMDPDVPGGEDVTGKHLREAEQLDEVKMSPSALKSFAQSPEAKGIRIGFEAEIVFPGLGGGGEDGDMEPDYDEDTRAYSIEDIINFFEYDDYGYGLSGREADRLRNELDEAWMEYFDEAMYDEWEGQKFALVKEYIENNDWDRDEQIREYLSVEYPDLDADEIIKKAQEATSTKDTPPEFKEADKAVDEELDARVEQSIADQDGDYDAALDEFRDNFTGASEEDWLRENYRYMSDVADAFNLTWPYIRYEGGDEDGYDEYNAEQLADDLSDKLGVKTKASSGYHSARRDESTWIFEPDSSLEANSGDMPVEIISPPMPLDEGLVKLREFFDWAKSHRAYTNDSTGFHMGVSLPIKGGNVDFLKLALMLGDEHVLKEFGRQANHFTEAAMKKIRNKLKQNPSQIGDAMTLLRNGLIELANKSLSSIVGSEKNPGFGKYTSINPKGNYIEFRSAGGEDYSEDIDKLENTLLRYARAMTIAANPAAERKEYYKKLYKLIAPEGNNKALSLFAKYAAGDINAETLKKEWAEEILSKEAPQEQQRSTWKVIDKATGQALPGYQYSGYTESEALALTKQAMSPGSSWLGFKQMFNDKYELRNVSASTGKWAIINRATGETLEVVDSENRGDAADLAMEKYAGKGIDYYIEPVPADAPKPKLSRRAELAKRIKEPKDKKSGVDTLQPGQHWEIYSINTGTALKRLEHTDRAAAAEEARTWIRMNGGNVEDFAIRAAGTPTQSQQPNTTQPSQTPAGADVQWRVTNTQTGDSSIINAPSRFRANAMVMDLARRMGVDFESVTIEPYTQPIPGSTLDIQQRRAQAAQQEVPPQGTPVERRNDQVTTDTGIPMWEIYDRATGRSLSRFPDHNMTTAWSTAQQWMRDAHVPEDRWNEYSVRPLTSSQG